MKQVLLKRIHSPFAMLGGCTSPSSSHLWGNSNLMPECARRRAAFLLSSSLLNCWVTRFLCTGFTLLPLSPPATSSGMGGRREGEVKGRKKMFMFTQDHYYDTAESHIKASPQAAREGWRREISDCKRNCLPLFFNRRRLAIKQAANIIWFQINHQCYALADTFCEFQGTDKALCCDLEELSSCCDFFNSPTATVS